MRRKNYRLIALLIFLLLLLGGNCNKDNGITICGTRCDSSAPWTVESLDMGNPCFGTKDTCLRWAATHGYSGKPCVRCDQ